MKQFLFFSLLFLNTITNAQINLIKNGGFEREAANWRGGEDISTISPYDKKSGKSSALINQYVGTDWKGIDQIFLVAKGTYAIEFSVWIKTESIEEQKEAYKAGVMIADFLDEAEKSIASEAIAQIRGTTPWTFYKKAFKTPPGTKKVRIMLALAQTSGSIYFDDVSAIVISEADYLKLNPEK
ncbi:carbohydrate binding domain-containing protein [Flavobacterium sp. FlaQc-57]|uniref:carbohydrate binding domain-containing protein n=1 Tax=Flavobacterium sp. FlaQc-57 TaxID=3374186 RepID=UPI0037584C01